MLLSMFDETGDTKFVNGKYNCSLKKINEGKRSNAGRLFPICFLLKISGLQFAIKY